MYPCDWFEYEWKKEAETWFPECKHMWAGISEHVDHNDYEYGGDHSDYHFLDVGLDNNIDHDNLHDDDDYVDDDDDDDEEDG